MSKINNSKKHIFFARGENTCTVDDERLAPKVLQSLGNDEWYFEITIHAMESTDDECEFFSIVDNSNSGSEAIITLKTTPEDTIIASISCNEETPLELEASIVDSVSKSVKIVFGKLKHSYYLCINDEVRSTAKAEILFNRDMNKTLKINNNHLNSSIRVAKVCFNECGKPSYFADTQIGNWSRTPANEISI